jgi:hypothetical protein
MRFRLAKYSRGGIFGKVATGIAVVSGLFYFYVGFAAEVYRVLGWHEGSVGSRKV